MIEPLHAIFLGVIEGATEFLPVSSTGHLILAARALSLDGEAVKTFAVVIQAGAMGAVLGLYRARVASMWQGLRGRDAAGRRLLLNLCVSFVPAAVVGVLLHHSIKALLFRPWPVVGALALGGLVMVLMDPWLRGRANARTLDALTTHDAFVIGLAQCASLWPGTSRAMVTLLAGMALGLPAAPAAEYSFLLALPTLGAATLFDAATGGGELLAQASALTILLGFAVAAAVAVLVVRGFLQYLTRRGLAPFGWYRLGLAAVLWLFHPHP